MEKTEFIALKIDDKIEFLWKYGEVVSQKSYYDCDITLFLLGYYYVEVFLNREQKLVMSVEVQENTQILYGYVKDLNINEIVKLLH